MNGRILPYADFLSRHGLRPHAVDGDAMSPTLQLNDIVLVRPASDFMGEAIYYVGLAHQRFYRVCSRFSGHEVILLSDNRRYPAEFVSLDWFRENVLGVAAFKLSALDDEARAMMRR